MINITTTYRDHSKTKVIKFCGLPVFKNTIIYKNGVELHQKTGFQPYT
jgi:hypothetical protein